MPITPIKYRIKDFAAITQEADLANKLFEVENPTGSATDQNYQVSFSTVVQAVANNLPGGNNAKVAVKTARRYSTADPDYTPGDETLTGLNPDFLCLFTTCWVEFPLPTTEYILVYDGTPNAPLQVWRDGDFTGQKIGAQWVPVDSIEARLQQIADFSPFTFAYNQGDNVKFPLGGHLRLFAAKATLVKSTFTPQQIPAPTGLSTDPNWQEIAAGAAFGIPDYLPGQYKRHDVVYQAGKIYRANTDYTVGDYVNNPGSFDSFPDPDYWQVIAGGSTPVYDDAPLTARVVTLEATVDYLNAQASDNYTEFDTRINGIVSTAPDYAPGPYKKDQLVTNAGILYKAKQDIQSSTVAPTATNAYWLQLGGGGSAAITGQDVVDVVNPYGGVTATLSGDGSVALNFGYESVNTFQIANGAVTETKLGDDVKSKLTDIQTSASALDDRVDYLENNGIVVENSLASGSYVNVPTIQAVNDGLVEISDYYDTELTQVYAVKADKSALTAAVNTLNGQFAAKADLAGGKLVQAQMPIAAFNVYGGVKPNGNYFTNNVGGQLMWTLPEFSSSGFSVQNNGLYSYQGELYRYQGADASNVPVVTFLANSTKVIYTAGIPVRNSTAVTFERNAEYYPISSGTFTVSDTGKVIGSVVCSYLNPSASAPTIPATGYTLLSGAYEAGRSLMYMFKVGANGSIQYTITKLD